MLHIMEFDSMRDLMVNSRGLLKAVIENKYCYWMDTVDKGVIGIQVYISDTEDYINKISIDSVTNKVINNTKHGGIPVSVIKWDNVIIPILSEYIKNKEKIINESKKENK